MSKFSIIIPTYNVEEYIGECISSILKQTFQDFEVIIVDDCSTDKTIEVIKSFNDDRIKIFRNKENKGPAYSRNKAINYSNGKYIVIVDSDDYILENRLEIINSYIERENPDVLFDNFYYFIDGEDIPYDNGYKKKKIAQNELKNIGLNEFIKNDLGIFKGVIKKSFIIENSILYNENYRLAEDFLFYLDCFLNNGKVLFIPETLYMYRQRKNSLITTVNEEYYIQLIKATEYVLSKLEGQLLIEDYTKKLLEERLRKQRILYNYYLISNNLKRREFKEATLLIFKDFKVTKLLVKNVLKKNKIVSIIK